MTLATDLQALETIDTRPALFAVITGDPVSGFQFCGPFISFEHADEYADREGLRPYTVVELTRPDLATLAECDPI